MFHLTVRRCLAIQLLIDLPARFFLIFAFPLLYNLHIDLILLPLRDYLAVSPHAAATAAPSRPFALLELRRDGQLLVRAD